MSICFNAIKILSVPQINAMLCSEEHTKVNRAKGLIFSEQEYILIGRLLGQTISLSLNQEVPSIKCKSKISQRYIIPIQIYFTRVQSILSDTEAFYLLCGLPTAYASPFPLSFLFYDHLRTHQCFYQRVSRGREKI